MAKFIYSTGRRKTSSARVFLYSNGSGQIKINGRQLKTHFPCLQHQKTVLSPLEVTETTKNFDIKATVRGGGSTGQAESIRHGLSRALTLHSSHLRGALKKQGFLTRDPRSVERKKYGRHKARKSTQFSKR